MKLHAATLWQCDFFTKKVLTIKGFRDAFVLVFLHVGTRRAFVTPASFNPNREWAEQQAKAFVAHVKKSGIATEIAMRDRDGKYTPPFDEALRDAGLTVRKSAPQSPNTQVFVERFIQTLQQECLDYIIPIGMQHLDHLVAEAVIRDSGMFGGSSAYDRNVCEIDGIDKPITCALDIPAPDAEPVVILPALGKNRFDAEPADRRRRSRCPRSGWAAR